MRVLVVGGGAREHALVWKLAASASAPELFAAPGNAGTAMLATNIPVGADDVDGLLRAAHTNAIDLTVVGPEGPLVAGVVDRFREAGLRIFGPTKSAAMIEGSKAFAKRVMREAGAPTAAFETFADPEDARRYVRQHGVPIVVKADGLAAGKGVVVAQTIDEALSAIDEMMVGKSLGNAGAKVVIEECLTGQEVSVFCFTDGKSVTRLVAACDYKRIHDGDRGPNTGGMGGYSPPPWWTDDLERTIRERCIAPVLARLAEMGIPYTGVLFGGLMLTDDGPQVIEFNARLGDPEAQLVLTRLENDFVEVVAAVVDGAVSALDLRTSDTCAVGVVLASEGYPGSYATGKTIAGLDALPSGALAFLAGVAGSPEVPVTSGGRVLTVVGSGATLAEARGIAYEGASKVSFEGEYHRTDIAAFAR
jgi:phosphoribosylamine--glycine ligase